jgi:hypothetical protein
VASAVLCLAVLAGCGEATTHAPSTGNAAATLPALQVKLAAIAGDECETQPAAQVYAGCARFVREVQNVVPAARAEVAAVPSPDALTKAADATEAAVDKISQDACVATGGAPTGSPQVCGPDHAALQQAFHSLVAAVGS